VTLAISLAFTLARPALAQAPAADPLALPAALPADTTAHRAHLPPWATALVRIDRLQHASLSLTIAAGIGLLARPRGEAFGFTLALGTLKELLDSRTDRFDPGDLSADMLGAALGAAASRGP